MRKRLRIYIKTIVIFIFLGVFHLSFRSIDRLLEVRSPHGIDQMRTFYDQVRNSVDVIFFGSSHVHVDINTGTLWEEYGIASYDLSGAEQPLWITYHVMREALKTQRPRLMVLECYAPSVFKEDIHHDWISENIMGMRFSLNKLQMMSVSLEPEHWMEYFPGIFVCHDRYKNLQPEDGRAFFTTARDRRSFKGFTPYFEIQAQDRRTTLREDTQGLTYKSQIYLNKIMDLCEKEGIPLFLIVSPYVIQSDLAASTQREIGEIAEQRGMIFINYNKDEPLERMELDYMTDLFDYSHLNYYGSVKYARSLGSDIRKYYDVPDHRQDKNSTRYESWERNAEDIHAQARENGYE